MGAKRIGWARIRSLINENDNQLKILREEVVSVSAGTTLTAGQSGAVVHWTHSTAHDCTLPAATVGSNFKFVLLAGAAAEHRIIAAGSDGIYGKAVVTGTTADKISVQVILKGAAKESVTMHKTTTTLGGDAGDTVELSCVEAGYWVCNANLIVVGNPGTIAVIADLA
tara:strand:- start:885 stop:1388 length:504 start_codon:yes stop_codon:yes gene_type:complete